MEEIFKEIKGWNGKYLISNLGRVKSVGGKYKKSLPNGYFTFGTTDSLGYKVFQMRSPGRKERKRIHSLVAEAFIQKPKSKEKLCVNHLDGVRTNNHVFNLEWCTHTQNLHHAINIGLWDAKGEKHKMAKLTKEKVIEMRRLRKEENLTHEEIGKRFGVCRRQAGDVIRGVNWGWLQDGL